MMCVLLEQGRMIQSMSQSTSGWHLKVQATMRLT